MSLGKRTSFRRMTDDKGVFRMTSLDQMPAISDPIRPKLAPDADLDAEVVRFKRLVIETFQDTMTAMLLDPAYAVAGCVDALRPQKGLLVSVEDPYSPKTEAGATRTKLLDDWTVGKAKRAGANAVKLLVWYRPDGDPDVNAHQQNLVREVGEQCRHYDIPLIFELLAYPGQQYTETLQTTVFGSVREFAKPEYQVDAFLVESPVPAADIPAFDTDGAAEVLKRFKQLGELAGRPWNMLSLGADMEQFYRMMHYAYAAGCSGYLAGRAYWLDALEQYPNGDKASIVMAANVRKFIEPLNALTDELANPAFALSPASEQRAGPAFCQSYQDI